MSQFEKKSVNNGNLAIWLNSLKLGHLQTPQGILYPRERQNPLKLPVQGYTAGRGYMCLAVAVCSGRGCLFLFAENFKNVRLK